MKISYISLLIGCFLFLANTLGAGTPYFEYSSNMRLAYKRALDLRVDEANILLSQIKTEEPDNHLAYYVENYLDFIQVFIDEDKATFEHLSKSKDRRLDILKEAKSDSPYYRYTRAEINMHWAFLHLKFGEYYSAYTNIKAAYHLQKDNLKAHPNFIPSKKSMGILKAFIGTVPNKYHWIIKLFSGMEGSITEGTKDIEAALTYYKNNNDSLFETETLILYSFMLLHINNKETERIWSLLNSESLDTKNSLLACFAKATMAMQIGKNDAAIEILENRPAGDQYYDVPYLDFMLGLAQFRKLDSSALVLLQDYIDANPNANYVKEAYHCIARYHLILGHPTDYQKYMTILKSKGNTLSDGDKSAQQEAESSIIPNPILLKARILFDGGYYQRAEATLMATTIDSFTSEPLQLEYTYRLGRIAHERKDFDKALQHYNQTIALGRDAEYYYACNAALKSGMIYEQLGQKELAKKSYDNCLSMSPNQYKSGLHGKAKIGLKRIE